MLQPHNTWTSLPRLALLVLLFLGLTAAGIGVVYSQFAERHFQFDRQLLNPGLLMAVAALLLVYFTSDGLRLYFTLRALGYRLRGQVIARLVFINLFFSNITPLATGGGVAQIWYLQHHGVAVGHATAATTIRTALAVVIIFSLTPVFLLRLEVLQTGHLVAELSGALLALISLYLVFFIILLVRTRWLIAPLSRLLLSAYRFRLISPPRHQRWQFKLRREMLRFARGFRRYRQGGWGWIMLSVGCTAVFLLSLFSFPVLLIMGLGYQVEYVTTAGLAVVTTFIAYFSPTPGAAGIIEGVFGSFFRHLLGVNHLLLVILAWRFITIYLGMLIGLGVTQREIIRLGGQPR
ncbi:MAG: UPF0104 family protein [Halomonadaceae bacterium]|nr:MAG: UPF0104 family protein [Halomonadaceae bacterium]